MYTYLIESEIDCMTIQHSLLTDSDRLGICIMEDASNDKKQNIIQRIIAKIKKLVQKIKEKKVEHKVEEVKNVKVPNENQEAKRSISEIKK